MAVTAAQGQGVSSAAASVAEGTEYGRYYWKNWERLELDASRVAVQAASLDDLVTGLKAAGIDPQMAKAFTVDGWWLVSTPAGKTPEQLVAALVAQPTISFATPVFFSLPVGPDQKRGPVFPTQDVMVGFADGTAAAQRDAALQETKVFENGKGSLRDRDWSGMSGVDRATAASKSGIDVLDAANSLAQRADVRFAEPDMMIWGMHDFIPNDPLFGDLWGLNNTGQSGGVADMDMNGPQAWDLTPGSSSVVVTVIDIGVQLNHPDLNIFTSNSDWTGQAGGGYPVNSCDNHGTACAGCVSAIINNSIGVTGIAPGCKVASARTFISNVPCDGSWTSQASWTVNAVNWAQSIGSRVTSNSNGYGFTSATIDTAYTNTHNNNNLVHFASNGNSGAASIGYPASSPSVNGCAAIDRTGVKASFSQYGPGTKFAAPGVTIESTDRTGSDGYVSGDYVFVDGTSFACPYSAGVAALVVSRNPGLTSAQVESIMYNHCKDLGAAGYDTTYGYGLPDARASVAAALLPGNDACGSAYTVLAGGVYTGYLDGATFSAGDGGNNCGSPNNGADVWYTYTANGPGTLRVTTCGTHDAGSVDSGIDTVLSLHSACGGAVLDCNDDWTTATAAGCSGLDTSVLRDSAVQTAVVAGQVVKIRVQRYGGVAAGNFYLNVFFTPANDACGSAIDVSSAASAGASGATFAGTLEGATNDGAASCGLSSSTPDVWYTFTAPPTCTPGVLRVTTCGTNDMGGVDLGMDTVLSLHTACGGSEITCDDDWTSATTTGCAGIDSGNARDSAVATTMTPGETVLIRVSKFGFATTGPFLLHVFYTPSNDDCANAIPVGNGTISFCTFGATTDGPSEPGSCTFFSYPQTDNDIWYNYGATCNGTATVTLCGSNYDTKINIYGGVCPAASGTVIACNDDFCGLQSTVSFAAVANHHYLIRVGGYGSAAGSGVMHISCLGCGSVDFNCDGDIGTDADIAAFFACIAGNCPAPPCASNADFNNDGDIGTDADIAAFFRVLGGGAC
jgi:hypothetical protein